MGEFLQKLPGVGKFIFRLVWPVFLLAVGGVVGNRADSAFLDFLPFLSDTTVNLWIVLLACLFVVAPAVGVAAHYYRSQRVAIQFIRLDDTLFRLLSTTNVGSDPEEVTRRLIEEFLEDTLELFADGCRIHLLRPDPSDTDYLKIWHSRGIPPETIERSRFYIGAQDNIKRGVAGKAYLDKQIRVVKIRVEKDRRIASSKEYISFVDKRKRIPYRSFVAVPITDADQESLGVLCIDSRATDTFDPMPIRNLLGNVADRLAATILILENQRSSPSSSQAASGPS